MNVTGQKTRNAILDAAVRIFMEKGFSAASMSDFCKECKLSRGGLYRYFDSTSAIFEAMLHRDKDDWGRQMELSIKAGTPAPQMLLGYLEFTKAHILAGDGRLSLAAYEYVRADPAHAAFAKARYQAAVEMISRVLQYGISRAEYQPLDIAATAEHFVIFIDGLRLASIFTLDPDTVERQLNALYQSIVKEETT